MKGSTVGRATPTSFVANKPTREAVALGVHYGVGAAGCSAAAACEIPLGAAGAKCCKPAAVSATKHRYENDVEVDKAGKLRLAADVACPAINTAVKCASGSFTVVITEKGRRSLQEAERAGSFGRRL